MSDKVLKSFTGTYEMTIGKRGEVIVSGTGKYKDYRAVFPMWQVREFIAGAP